MEKDKLHALIVGILLVNNLLLMLLVFYFININIQGAPLYERVVERFAQTHDYDVEEYNCVNYSEDLAFILENLGYETEQVRQIPLEDGYHRRLQLNLEIEPQTSEVIINKQ